MAYVLKNTSGLVNTRVTDAGRQKMSQGNFNISYFQIGDSEVTYNLLPTSYNQSKTHILEPNFNSHNSSGVPQSNKQNVKYPFYVDGNIGNTYGIPYMDSVVSPVFNTAPLRGFFYGNIESELISWSALTNNQYVINSNYVVPMSALNCTNVIEIKSSICNPTSERGPSIGDLVTIFFNREGDESCDCINLPSPTPTTTPTNTPPTGSPTQTPTPTMTASAYDCYPTPTPTPSKSPCLTPSPSPVCPLPEPPYCSVAINSCYPMMTYRIVNVCDNKITLDRETPTFTAITDGSTARILVYPPNMTTIYDSYTPKPHWGDDVINYESICGIDEFDVKIWNMNIPWSESPAGLNSTTHKGYTNFGSIGYLGTKEYLGYASDSGQTDSSYVYYYNSFDEKITVTPEEQKAISIIHYTNNTIDFFYGEKFALEPYDENATDTTGQARNFKIHIPWIMWHKASGCCEGQTFWVDPPGFDELTPSGSPLFTVNYIQSTKNNDMNDPGIRYYHLWDNNPNSDGYPNRIGKVFPDQKIIVIDDEEIIAAMSYKSNRNWTLPSPKVSLITPNVCGTDSVNVDGILTGNTEYLHVTYRLTDTKTCLNSLHCNYYTIIQGPNVDCNNITSQNVAVRFGNEFNCLSQPDEDLFISQGFYADKLEIICQKVSGTSRPNPTEWKIIDFSDQLSATTFNGYLTQSGITGNTFVITEDLYDSASNYNLNDYITLPIVDATGATLNFGDEYYFYGSLETDIQATIYEMKYKINLGQTEFQSTSNPTWSTGTKPYITEIGLYDSDKTLMIISKLQSPVLRQGIQQFLVKLDF